MEGEHCGAGFREHMILCLAVFWGQSQKIFPRKKQENRSIMMNHDLSSPKIEVIPSTEIDIS